MLVKDIFKVVDVGEVSRIIVIPKTQPVLGQMPNEGRFISISISDREKMEQIADLEVEQLSVSNNMLTINV
jgi:hypothetical protein